MRSAVKVALAFGIALFFLLAPRMARAAGVLYIAKGGGELPLEKTDVDVDVAGSVVSATVSQRFTNARNGSIEVVYVFPLPQRAAVDAMEMRIGARTVRASIDRRQAARAAYDRAVHEGRHAALLEQERPNIFTFSVGNIEPGAAIDVKLHYFEVAAFDHGTYEIAVPTTVGPRFKPESVTDAARISPAYGNDTGVKLGLRVHLDGGTDLQSVSSPTHTLTLARPSPRIADAKLKSDAELPNKDFVFRWTLAADTVKPAAFAHRPTDKGPGYVSLLLEPKHDPNDVEIAPRELFFLLDTSGSMQGTPLETALAAVKRAIDAMGPSDTFQIIDFADSASAFAPRPLQNTAANRAKAHAYVSSLRASGGTNQLAGIHAALSAAGDEDRLRYVMFMTDGYIGNEAEVIALTRREIGRARIFSFGIGSSVNRYLLDEVAIAGRGFAEYLKPNENGKELVERFYRRIGRPYLTDIEIDWGGLAVSDLRPLKLPDLSAFEPLVVHARYAKAGAGEVTVRGRVSGRAFATKLRVTLPDVEPKNEAFSRLWARATIAELERRPNGTVDVEAVTRVALEHNLMSRYTSFVAIDSTPGTTTGYPTLVEQPSEAPSGVDVRSAGGTVVGGAAPAPAYADRESSLALSPGRSGGCAGCTTVPRDDRGPAALLVLVGLGVLGLRRRGKVP